MLNMKVLDYRITSNENQITVTRSYTSEKTNEEAFATVGFYPTLPMALRGIQTHYTLAGGKEIQTIKDYREALQEVAEAFRIELEG